MDAEVERIVVGSAGDVAGRIAEGRIVLRRRGYGCGVQVREVAGSLDARARGQHRIAAYVGAVVTGQER